MYRANEGGTSGQSVAPRVPFAVIVCPSVAGFWGLVATQSLLFADHLIISEPQRLTFSGRERWYTFYKRCNPFEGLSLRLGVRKVGEVDRAKRETSEAVSRILPVTIQESVSTTVNVVVFSAIHTKDI